MKALVLEPIYGANMKNRVKTPAARTILDLVQSRYKDLNEAGVYVDSEEGGYQIVGTGAVSSDDLVDYLLDGAESHERAEMIAILDASSMHWITR